MGHKPLEFDRFTLLRVIYFHSSYGGKLAGKLATYGHESGQIRPRLAKNGQKRPRVPCCHPLITSFPFDGSTKTSRDSCLFGSSTRGRGTLIITDFCY